MFTNVHALPLRQVPFDLSLGFMLKCHARESMMKTLRNSKTLADADKALLERCRAAVAQIDPSAELILYGSRARGEGRLDSDWDLLILLSENPDVEIKARIRRALYEVEWSTGEVISTVVRAREDWRQLVIKGSPFCANVQKEGVRLWAGIRS
jgi:predicted nucleotidyltransferase